MTRTVPGSGAVIEPIFDEIFGVRAVKVKNGGSGYDPADPPRLTVTGCGTPDVEALLYPIIDSNSGKIIHVRVLERGRGYDPLRLQIVPTTETPNVINSFDINRIWQTHPNSLTRGTFNTTGTPPIKTDRLRIESDNHPKPSPILAERAPGGGPLVDQSFDQTFVYRGGKDVPNPGTREEQKNKVLGILSNGGLLHTPEWGTDGNAPVGFAIDSVKYAYLKNANEQDVVTENNVNYYQSSKTLDEFGQFNSVFEWGKFRQYTWNVKVEYGNLELNVVSLDETLGSVEVGRIVDEIGGTARGEIAKIVRNAQNVITKVYLREVTGTFSENDSVLGSNGFQFTISEEPISRNIFYIDFGPQASEFGPFIAGTFYFAPENIQVKANSLIILNQSDPSNQEGIGHPIQFSTTQDGLLNGGTLYYNSTGSSAAAGADYENEYRSLFLMNGDETSRIYYYCKNHRYMSGSSGDEGYITLSSETHSNPIVNNYYVENYYGSGETLDYSRHVDGHSKIVGMSFDGYPIYGPYGYNTSGSAVRMVSSYRLKTTDEKSGARPEIVTPTTVTYNVTVSNNRFVFGGSTVDFLRLNRGDTVIFNQDDSSNDGNILLISDQDDGWHSSVPIIIGETSDLYDGEGIAYYLDDTLTTYSGYVAGFDSATNREIRFTVPVNSPRILYLFSYLNDDFGVRTIQEGYVLGDLTDDYIYDSTVSGATLDEFNGKYGPTPEYPNGTYAYFMTEDSSGNPVYPYVIGPKYYGVPLFVGDDVPEAITTFPTETAGDVVLDDNGAVSYIKMTRTGDNYFGSAKAYILGGEGSGAAGTPIVQTVTGLSLLNEGRSYASPPTLIFEGGGGQGAQGAADVDTTGKISSISVVDGGEFYQEPPYVLINGGGGIGARAEAVISQGQITAINVTEPGEGYTSAPQVIFTKLVNLKRKTRARQSNNSTAAYLTSLLKDVEPSDTTIYVQSTDAFPGSGDLILNDEKISYTSKSRGRFTGLTRGVNNKYDQRIILDSGQNNPDGTSNYKFNVGDRVIRRVENQNNKVAKVYDWDPSTRELLVTFEVDELAFIDAGFASTEDAIVQFDAGVANSTGAGILPHTVESETGSTITLLTVPISTLQDSAFLDDVGEVDSDGNPIGDGIPDLINTGTDYENQINLDGGIYNSLYGIEETQGGQNTTLFAVGDNIKDADIPFKYATVTEAGGLSEGVDHTALVYLTLGSGNNQNFSVNEIVTGSESGVRGTVVSWDASTKLLTLKDIVPYNTGNINIGIGGYLYEFSYNSTVVDFLVQNAGTNYSAVPTITVENNGDIQATGTVVMTTAGDQVDSITITTGGYGIKQSVDSSYVLHPTVTFTNDPSDTTGSGAVVQAILGGENATGNGGASYRIKSISYSSSIRS